MKSRNQLQKLHGVTITLETRATVAAAQVNALTTLSNFILPGDTAASSRYWEKDIIDPEVVVENGKITVPEKCGIGYEPNREIIQQFTVSEKSYF